MLLTAWLPVVAKAAGVDCGIAGALAKDMVDMVGGGRHTPLYCLLIKLAQNSSLEPTHLKGGHRLNGQRAGGR